MFIAAKEKAQWSAQPALSILDIYYIDRWHDPSCRADRRLD